MDWLLRSLSLWLVGAGCILLQSVVGAVFSLHPFIPHWVLPIVLFLGISPDTNIVRGALMALLLGFSADVAGGSGMSLETFLAAATYALARGTGLRLMMRSLTFQFSVTFLVASIAIGATEALRALFSAPSPFPIDTSTTPTLRVLASASATALVAPMLFRAVRQIERVGRRREDVEV